MDELTMVRELAPVTEAPDPAVLRATRAAILEAAGQQRAPRSAGASRRWTRRRTVAAVGVVVTAAAVTTAVLVAPATQFGSRPPAAQASAAEVLMHAATVARSSPDVVPRADQYVYVANGGAQLWLSVDGTHDGLSIDASGDRASVPGCRGGVTLVEGNYEGVRPQPCTPVPAYRPDLPTDVDGMYAYLAGDTLPAGDAPDPAAVNRIGKLVHELYSMTYLTGDQQAALFDAVARIPGLQVTRDATGPGGERGTAVSWDGPGTGESDVLLFDPSTHELDSFYTRAADGSVGGGLRGAPQLVDQPGERP